MREGDRILLKRKCKGMGCLRFGRTVDLPLIAISDGSYELHNYMHEAVELHVRGLLEDKLPIPESTSFAEYVAVN